MFFNNMATSLLEKSSSSEENNVVYQHHSMGDLLPEYGTKPECCYLQWMRIVNLPNIGFTWHHAVTIYAYIQSETQNPHTYVCPNPLRKELLAVVELKLTQGYYVRKLEKTIEVKHLDSVFVWKKEIK